MTGWQLARGKILRNGELWYSGTYPGDACRARSGHWTWAGGIQASSLGHARVSYSRRPCSSGVETGRACGLSRSSSHPSSRRLCSYGGHHGLDEHAVTHGAVEVTLALDAAIILARLLLELDADPFSDLKMGLTGEPDGTFAAIGELDRLAGFEVGHYCGALEAEKRIVSVVKVI